MEINDRRLCTTCRKVDRRKVKLTCVECHRSFHSACVGIVAEVARTLQGWTCNTCGEEAEGGQEGAAEPERADVPERVDAVEGVDAPEGGEVPERMAEEQNALQRGIVNRRCRVLTRIPKASRPLAASTYNTIITQLLDSNLESEELWIKLLSFSYCCLKAPRSGRKHRRVPGEHSLTTKVTQALRSYAAEPTPDPPRRSQRDTIRLLRAEENEEEENDRLAKRVSEKISEYDITGAVRLAASDAKLIQPTEEVATTLRSKHPVAPEDRSPAPHRAEGWPVASLQVTEEQILGAATSFPNGSAGGMDGLRPQHLVDMLSAEAGAPARALLRTLTIFVNRVLSSGLPTQFRPTFFGANLLALQKPDGGVRPIAVGLTLRRLCSKVATYAIRTSASDHLQPHQVGFAVAGGCEAAVHAARTYLQRAIDGEEDKVALKVDFSNAFNTLRRDRMLRTIYDLHPNIYRYVEASYGTESLLNFGNTVITSAEGVQQGDPMGPFLFAVTLHSLVTGLGSEFNCWYLDDGTLISNRDTIEADFHKIEIEGRSLGLVLNRNKCEYSLVNSTLQEDSPLQASKQVSQADLTLLGAPLGHAANHAFLEEKIAMLSRFSERLQLLQPHQALFLLSKSMALPRLVYGLRTSDLSTHHQLTRYDTLLRQTLMEMLNINLSNDQWMQASLPIRHGGLGIRAASDVALPAFLSSCVKSRRLACSIMNVEETTMDGEVTAIDNWSRATSVPVPETGRQQDWDLPLIDRAKTHITDIADDEREQARVRAAMSEGSGDWLHAIPIPSLGQMLNPAELRIAVSLRIGCSTGYPHQCASCNNARVDELGLHGLHCPRSAGRLPRHHAANDIIKRALASAQVASTLEPAGLARENASRPDGVTITPWKEGRCMVWDFTCCDTFAPTNLAGTARVAGAASRAAEARKEVRYRALAHDYIVIPVAVETGGSVGPATSKFIKDLSKRLIAATGDKKAGFYFRQRLGIAIQRGNALSVLGTIERPEGTLFE